MSEMERIPVRFKRVAAAFDEVARMRPCQSSGSEHSPESWPDLSDLVNSFLERSHKEDVHNKDDIHEENEVNSTLEMDAHFSNCETKHTLRSLLLGCGDDNGDVKRNIHTEVQQAYRDMVNGSSPGFKRHLMTRLRDRGLDAGLCKSKWEKTSRYPSGNHEFIDVNVAGTRYIVEVYLAGEFEIARAGKCYTSLLENFPQIFVGKVEELKQVVKLMCGAIKKSMKSVDLYVPPWRRYRYMKVKWFGSYKRTTNEFLAKMVAGSDEDLSGKISMGFLPLPSEIEISYYCRENFGRKVGKKVGNLSAALNGTSIVL